MNIAVTYEDGNVFQHFGHAEAFKIYDVEDGKVVSSRILRTDGSGHGALAGLLADHTVDVLICGGIGAGAQEALSDMGIELCAGASGNADEAVAAYLKGELVNTGVNCDHHACHDGDHACHRDDGRGNCSGQKVCGKNTGKTVKVHYRGTLPDGTQFDSSYERDEPLEFVCGAGNMIAGFDKAVANMEVGEKVEVHLMPSEAYGEVDPQAIFDLNLSWVPGSENLSVGERVFLQDSQHHPIPVTVIAKDDTTITFDANHELAGKELVFLIELVEVLE